MRKGASVLFISASQMLMDLASQDSSRALDRRLRHYTSRTGLLVIDEVGFPNGACATALIDRGIHHAEPCTEPAGRRLAISSLK